MKMAYTLQEHGDYYEQKYWYLVKDTFPNYEIFWKDFIVPLTKRGESGGIDLRENIHCKWLIELAMAHYTVFYHLTVAEDLRLKFVKNEYEFSEHVFYHLSSATEMVERLLFTLDRLVSDLNETDSIQQYSSDNITTKAQDYSKKRLSERFQKI
ncbi:MAG: hypothetical protein DDG59_15310 [Anaerolineae bacterium]|nr:MAG: hypothetical protein DDG59_15310 [Anaerolineae bacterium]